jgi:hypothetical protein
LRMVVCVLARLPLCHGRARVASPSNPTVPSLQHVGPLAGAGEQGLRSTVCCLSLRCFAVCGVLARKLVVPPTPLPHVVCSPTLDMCTHWSTLVTISLIHVNSEGWAATVLFLCDLPSLAPPFSPCLCGVGPRAGECASPFIPCSQSTLLFLCNVAVVCDMLL